SDPVQAFLSGAWKPCAPAALKLTWKSVRSGRDLGAPIDGGEAFGSRRYSLPTRPFHWFALAFDSAAAKEARMSVLETDLIDYIYLDDRDETPVLVVSDPLTWRPPEDQRHLDMLRDKLNAQIVF